MKYQSLIRLGLAIAAFSSLAACTIVPAHPVGYRSSPVVVDSYPVYRSNVYYYDRHDHRDYRPAPRPAPRRDHHDRHDRRDSGYPYNWR